MTIRELILDLPPDPPDLTDCVYARVVGQGMPVRLTREAGRQLVEIDKDGEYCDESVWREHQEYVARHRDEGSSGWPFSAPLYVINAKGQLEGVWP